MSSPARRLSSETRLDALLDAARLPHDAMRRDDLLQAHAALEPAVDALYALPGVRYESPALVFRAASPEPPWGERDAGSSR